MVRLDIKGIYHRETTKGEKRYKHYISFDLPLCERFNINYYKPHETPVEVLTIKEFENLQKKESDEKQRAVSILNKIIEDQKEKINELGSIIDENNKTISSHKDKNKEFDLKIYDLEKNMMDFNQTIEEKDKKESDLTTQIQNKDNKIVKLDKTIKILKDSLHDSTTNKDEISKLTMENTDLLSAKRRLKNKNDKIAKRIQEQDDELKKLSIKLETIKETHEDKLQDREKIYREQFNQLQERYDQLNKDKEKCISLNSSLITDFKHILNFGFLDLIRKKHKTTIEAAIKKEIPDKNREFKAVLVKDS